MTRNSSKKREERKPDTRPEKSRDREQFPDNRAMLFYFLRGSKAFFACSILFAALSSVFDLLGPKVVGFTVDSIIGSKEVSLPGALQTLYQNMGGTSYFRQHIGTLSLIVTLLAVLCAVFRYLFRVFNSKGTERFVKTIRDDVFRHIERLPFTWYSENHTGDIIQRCTSDVETLSRFLSEQLTGLARTSLLLALAIYFMSGISGRLTLYAAAFVPVIIAYSLFFHGKIGRGFLIVDEEESRLSAVAQENLTGVRVIRAFGREMHERERFEAQNEVQSEASRKLSLLMSAFWCTGDFISGLQTLTIMVVGALFAMRGTISVGDYIAFVTYNSMLVWPIRSLGRVISEMSKAGVSITRIREIMNAKEEQDRTETRKADMRGDIVFDRVSFRYAKDLPQVLDRVSFTIPGGSTFGILGSTGSGKSTLMALLDRLYVLPSDQGRILVGGVDIADMKAQELRGQIGMVLQEPYLFSRTIAENIAITQPSVNMDDVKAAAKDAALDEAVEKFTAGYDTMVGERGVTLSGGQKQRTAIAQTLIRDTPVMIFDDSLSAVDAETDAKIRTALLKKAQRATTILISHRITTLMQADRILVLHHGKVAEIGTHEELLEKGGIYRRICRIQGIVE